MPLLYLALHEHCMWNKVPERGRSALNHMLQPHAMPKDGVLF